MLRNLQEKSNRFSRVYPVCHSLIPETLWLQLIAAPDSPELFPDILDTEGNEFQLPEYLGDLARLEVIVFNLAKEAELPEAFAEKLAINPTLEFFEISWKNLTFLLAGMEGPVPKKESENVIVWRHPVNGRIRVRPATDEDLLVMKMALEGLAINDVAKQAEVPGELIETTLFRAMDDGIIIGPESKMKRYFKPADYKNIDSSFFTARVFTLQWHITQSCDLHCRHCYDRNQYKSLTFAQEINILNDLAEFCTAHGVHGQVTFSGGNPLLHQDFEKLYQEAVERGFTTAILGNPTTREVLERLLAIQPLAFYQVSLEGLPDHNDYMRGRGHFKRILTFLDLLRDLDIYSMVMLTLTRDNMGQILPLAEILDNRTDLFTFNRLSLVGEGANLVMADKNKFPAFLRSYLEAAESHPCLGLKDNLFNIIQHINESPVFGGCTGFGCGAALNFITVLADGSVHACRKFPSLLGNILDNSLTEVYHSEAAERYRQGSAACRDCAIRPVCGGCLAVSHSHNLDIFKEKDPYCFIDSQDLVT
ncbi:MAG: thio(seleno)oxazole modification radical SAM maturase SbtM [Desulfobulbales bacterium]